jgi:hypothetical protein
MSIPYATATSGDKALMELQRTLAKFGCQSFWYDDRCRERRNHCAIPVA